MLKRSTLREIRSTFGRYIAMFAIIALGVGFFTGLRVTEKAFIKTADKYFNDYRMFDFRIVSTLGLTDEDIAAMAEAEGVSAAAGAVFEDVLVERKGSGDFVLRAHSMTEGINVPEALSGRLPSAPDECIADRLAFSESDIGTYIRLSSENDADTLDAFRYDEYLIVGIADSVYYLNYERGTTSVGSGRISGFAFIPPEGFRFDCWTEAYLTLDETGYAYSEEYEAAADAAEKWVTELAEERAGIRYDDIFSEADEKIKDAEKELADGREEYRTERADAEIELSDAKKELEDAEKKLEDGWSEYYNGVSELNTETAEAERKLLDAEIELSDAKTKLEDGEREYSDGLAEYNTGLAEYEDGLKKYEDGLAEYEDGAKRLEDAEKELSEAKKDLTSAEIALSSAWARLDEGEASYTQLKTLNDTVTGLRASLSAYFPFADNAQLIAALEAGSYPGLNGAVDAALAAYAMDSASLTASWRAAEAGTGAPLTDEYLSLLRAQLDSGMSQYQDGADSYIAGVQEYEKGVRELEKAKSELADAKAELEDSETKLNDAKSELNSAKTELTDARAELDDGRAEYEDGLLELEKGRAELITETDDAKRKLRDAKQELISGEAEYEDGLVEYNDAHAEALTEFADAEAELSDGEAEIADARRELADLEYPDVYVLGRAANIGYVCFENDANIVKGISTVFPLFFFLVAALVCITTMTRMVDEQRTQTGVLKALGFSNAAIMGKFMFYSGSASLFGCVGGFLAGSVVFPTVLWKVYDIMYGFSDVVLVFDARLAVLSIASYLLCAFLSTWSACRAELVCAPAELIRPKAPKSGKRILLEYLGFIWKRMSFLQKVSARNILRYVKRLVMMVLGVGGCTALLLTGFGIYDSIRFVAEFQYEEISLYDCSVNFGEEPDETRRSEFAERYGEGGIIFLHESTADVMTDETTKAATLVVFGDDDISPFVDLHLKDSRVPLPGKGEAVINNELASRLGVSEGGTVTLRDNSMDMLELTVSGIFENYVYNYIYVSADTYAELTGEAAEIKTAYLNFADGTDANGAAASMMSESGVSSVTLSNDVRERADNMLESLIYIIVLIVLCAGALAFIVIYNLTNININERVREIATIKVLGFTKSETAKYVFRENIVESLIGAVAGLIGGKFLHAFVIAQIKIDMMSFDVRIAAASYFYAIGLTVAFALIVDIFLLPKLAHINMAESLKSIE